MNGAAVSKLAAHRVDDAGVAAEHVAEREQARQQVDAAPEAPALQRGPAPQRVQAGDGRSVAAPARAASRSRPAARGPSRPPARGRRRATSTRGGRRQEQVDPRPELHHAEPVARPQPGRLARRGTRRAARGRRRSAGRRPALPSWSIQISLRSFSIAGLGVGRPRRKLPGLVLDPRHRPATGMRFTCTSSGDRKMLTCCHSPGRRHAGLRGAGDDHPAVGRRQHRVRPRAGSVRSGSRKKQRDARREDRERQGARRGRLSGHEDERGQQGAGDERVPGAVDLHEDETQRGRGSPPESRAGDRAGS